MSDFPRGWTVAGSFGAAATPNVTQAATPGVAHVLDSFFTSIIVGAAVALPVVQVAISGISVSAFDQLVPIANSKDSTSFSGLSLASIVGGAIGVQWDRAVPTGGLAYIVIQGHDI
jgi:lipoprotein signal peptidase